MITLPRRRSASRLSLTPLIDVVFILLIFFMLESDFLRPYVIELPPPGGSARSASAKSTPLLVELHSDQSIWINKGNYAMADVEHVLYEFNPASDSPVVVACDPGVILQRTVSIIDILHRRGLTNIAITEGERFD